MIIFDPETFEIDIQENFKKSELDIIYLRFIINL